MENELYEICSLLNGYTVKSFMVLRAEQDADGTWNLKVKAKTPNCPVKDKEAADD